MLPGAWRLSISFRFATRPLSRRTSYTDATLTSGSLIRLRFTNWQEAMDDMDYQIEVDRIPIDLMLS